MNKSILFDEENPPAQLVELLLGPIRWQVIYIALDNGLFDHLISPKTAEEIAKTLSFQEKQTRLWLDCLCAIGVLEKNKNHYRTKKIVEPYLISESDYSMRDMLLHLSHVRHADIKTYQQVLETGESAHLSANFQKKEFWDNSQKCLCSFHKSISSSVVIDILRKQPQWSEAKSILDLGAGSALLAKKVTDLRSDINVTLFDLPNCAQLIQTSLNDDQGITVIGGDFNIDDFSGSYDIVLASMSLYYAKDIVSLMKKIKQALNQDGIFISFHEGLSNERTSPEAHVTGRFLPAISGNDLSFDEGFIAEKMQESGFKKVVNHFIDMPTGEMNLTIGYLV